MAVQEKEKSTVQKIVELPTGSLLQEEFRRITLDALEIGKLVNTIKLSEEPKKEEPKKEPKHKKFDTQVALEKGRGPYTIVQMLLDTGKRLRKEQGIKKGTFQELAKIILSTEKPEDFQLQGDFYRTYFLYLTNWITNNPRKFKDLQEAVRLRLGLSEVSGEKKRDPEVRNVKKQTKRLLGDTLGAMLVAYSNISLGNPGILSWIREWSELTTEPEIENMKERIASTAQNIIVLSNKYLADPLFSKINKIEDFYTLAADSRKKIDTMRVDNPELVRAIEIELKNNPIEELLDASMVNENLPIFSKIEQYITKNPEHPEYTEQDKEVIAQTINNINARNTLDKIVGPMQKYFSPETSRRDLNTAKKILTDLQKLLA